MVAVVLRTLSALLLLVAVQHLATVEVRGAVTTDLSDLSGSQRDHVARSTRPSIGASTFRQSLRETAALTDFFAVPQATEARVTVPVVLARFAGARLPFCITPRPPPPHRLLA